ncbi:MAG: transglutaminase domain-containing protein [Elusimicrobia bacterium]|nr:transglutaminase domain-containing protein [Elusimicrobiota bacterium]
MRPALATALTLAMTACLAGQREAPSRTIEFDETVRVSVPRGARELRLWIPKPPDSGPQTARLVRLEAPVPYAVTREPEFGNETIFLRADRTAGRTLEVRLSYVIGRRPQGAYRGRIPPTSREREPRGLLAVDDGIRAVADAQTRGLVDPFEKARALYGFVLKMMSYDKSEAGWGLGDSLRACSTGKGNCTDFHSLFIALALAQGIPARFMTGLAIPRTGAGQVLGYHCWAEFHAGDAWVPVDISEAWKNPALAARYFGSLDADRILLSTGRAIRLAPPQQGPAINFLHEPYAEADGRPLAEVTLERRFRERPAWGG